MFLSNQEARYILNNSSPHPTAFQPIRIDFNALLWPTPGSLYNVVASTNQDLQIYLLLYSDIETNPVKKKVKVLFRGFKLPAVASYLLLYSQL